MADLPDHSASRARERAPRRLFWTAAVLLALSYGVIAGTLQLFPYGVFALALDGWARLSGTGDENWYRRPVRQPAPPPIFNTARAQPGVNLVTEIRADTLAVKVMDLDGRTLHEWRPDWFAIWPDAAHVPERLRPRERPGTHVNGAALLENGDVVFNFEHLGLVRLDRAGKVVWRLPYLTHHSVHRAGDGNLWVCGQREHTEPSPRLPCLRPPFVEDTLLVVSPDGVVVKEWSVPELLVRNGRAGLLCLAGQDDFSTATAGDVTHLNHVEPFPTGMPAGRFGPGDVLVSLRNVNTVFVFDSRTDRIKLCSTGQFVRQHDPHFVDGDTLSVFDNNNVATNGEPPRSRIALLSADGAVHTHYGGAPGHTFFTPILGRHQWLANGNLLITDSCAGRAFEVDRGGEVVWWYVNYCGEGEVGAIEQVQRLPVGFATRQRPH